MVGATWAESPAAGGTTTASGTALPSDSTRRLTADDVPVLRQLGIRTAIDFRSAQELSTSSASGHWARPRSPTSTRRRSSSCLVRALSMNLRAVVDFYTSMIEARRTLISRPPTRSPGEDALPTVFSCMAGKDRTGVFAAIVLGLLGVPDTVIVEDYVLTHEVMPQIAAKRSAEQATQTASAGHDVSANRWAGMPEELLGAHAFVMEGLIDHVRSTFGAAGTSTPSRSAFPPRPSPPSAPSSSTPEAYPDPLTPNWRRENVHSEGWRRQLGGGRVTRW